MNIRSFHYDEDTKTVHVSIDASDPAVAMATLMQLHVLKYPELKTGHASQELVDAHAEKKPRTTTKAKVHDEPKPDPRQPELPFKSEPQPVERFTTPALGAEPAQPEPTVTPPSATTAPTPTPAPVVQTAPATTAPSIAAPPDLVSAMSFKDVMVWMQKNGFTTVEAIAAECAKYRSSVPVLGRIGGVLEERISRALVAMAAN